MTDFVIPYYLTPLAGEPDGQVLTDRAAIGNGQPSRAPAVALVGQTSLAVVLLEMDGADPDVPGRAYDVAGPAVPAMPDGRGQRGVRVPGRRNGR